jgi:hypothetical protein
MSLSRKREDEPAAASAAVVLSFDCLEPCSGSKSQMWEKRCEETCGE